MITKMTAFPIQEMNEETVLTYSCVESEIESDEFGKVRTYGIEIRICANNESNPAHLLLISDISTDREKVQRLAELMTELQIHPVHVGNVIEDFLFDLSVE